MGATGGNAKERTTALCWPEPALPAVLVMPPPAASAACSPAHEVMVAADRLAVLGTGLPSLIVGRSAMAEAAGSTPRAAAGETRQKGLTTKHARGEWVAACHPRAMHPVARGSAR